MKRRTKWLVGGLAIGAGAVRCSQRLIEEEERATETN